MTYHKKVRYHAIPLLRHLSSHVCRQKQGDVLKGSSMLCNPLQHMALEMHVSEVKPCHVPAFQLQHVICHKKLQLFNFSFTVFMSPRTASLLD